MSRNATPSDHASRLSGNNLTVNLPVFSPAGSRRLQVNDGTHQGRGGVISDTEVPDSEEERLRAIKPPTQSEGEIIEIFSSDNSGDDDPHVGRIPGEWPETPQKVVSRNPRTQVVPDRARPPRKVQTPRSRRIIQSSSSEASDSETPSKPQHPEVIELSDGSPDRPQKAAKRAVPASGPLKPTLLQPSRSAPEKMAPLYADDEDEDEDDPWHVEDGSILTLNEPKSARKPIRRTARDSSSAAAPFEDLNIPNTPTKGRNVRQWNLNSDDESVMVPSIATPGSLKLTSTKSSSALSSAKTPRITKKGQVAAEQSRREQYAIDLFKTLNNAVFDNELPKETKLNWNKRLLTTAGRAKWHRSRGGVHTTEIELATKILDCDERIRSTLAHEMCHLACWIINGEPKEGHGKIFKGWAARVERRRTDILVTTKHNYDISYPYEWECEQCAKVYGRFSKSIRPDECLCGACKVGKLVPLFTQRAPRTPKVRADSRMAPEHTQGSPCSISHRQLGSLPEESAISHPAPSRAHQVYVISDSDDSEVEVLTTILGGVKI